MGLFGAIEYLFFGGDWMDGFIMISRLILIVHNFTLFHMREGKWMDRYG